MNDLQIFENEQFGKIRTVMIDGEPWIVGKDVASALEYVRPTKAVRDYVDQEDIRVVPIEDSIGRFQKTPVINESGMYSLVFGSQMDKAKEFKRWVTHDVLPTLRKTGIYTTGQLTAPKPPTMAIVKEMELRYRIMERMGCTPYEIAGMMTSMDMAYGIAISKAMTDKVDPQLCLFDAPAETPQLPTTAIS